MEISKIVITGGPCAGKSTAMSKIQNAFTQMGYKVLFVSENTELSFMDTTINLFVSELEDSGNERSLAVLFRKGNCDILITGDRSDFGERCRARYCDTYVYAVLRFLALRGRK